MVSHTQIRLADYAPPDFLVERVHLDVDIRADHAVVSSRLSVRRNPASKNKSAPLFLNGENQKLLELNVNGAEVRGQNFRFSDRGITIFDLPALNAKQGAVVEVSSTHDPYKNTALSGFYASGPMLVTQCEAEGFRRITYYPDRPDVMATFTVTIHADKKKFPVLLANGNRLARGAESGGRHWVRWEDPFPKPCYLFAMVAGAFDRVAEHFITQSGRRVLLELYVEPGKKNETMFARRALKKAMRWDEERFGLEYDLDRFMLVATPFFNMGAMENKGLNIFNDSCVLGRAETATDSTISFIERVVGHEYFHNWTGDRITCRDWFQLSLKEGLTVFREQEFCGDMHSAAVERIGNVRDLRRAQFAEDAGPMAHPVRPDHYQAIDNFYTTTVYDKGAEVVRMLQTLLGRKAFRKGMDLYFKRHDGQAVTCDDFVRAILDGAKSTINVQQFMLWYQQAGTPVIKARSRYDAKAKTLRLSVAQSVPPTPKQEKKKPMLIPLAVGLLDDKGRDLIGTKVLPLTKPREEFIFRNIKSPPVLSLLRDFSAPVKLDYPQTDNALLFLLAHDSDPFNRWEAGQKLFLKRLLPMIGEKTRATDIAPLAGALAELLRDPRLDSDFKTFALIPPSEAELGLVVRAAGGFIDPAAIYAARIALIGRLAKILKPDLEKTWQRFRNLSATASDGVSMGKRALKNMCLADLVLADEEKFLPRAYRQLTESSNMSDQVASLAILAETDSPLRARGLAFFEKRWRGNARVMDRWLSVQASARRADALKTVQSLMSHSAFDIKNPNRVSALIGAFTGNAIGFHAANGSGYRFVAEMIARLDPINPHSAAGLARAFLRWRDYEPKRRARMQAELKSLSRQKLSPNSHEIVGKSLAGG